MSAPTPIPEPSELDKALAGLAFLVLVPVFFGSILLTVYDLLRLLGEILRGVR